jgi:hypothetical protein
MPIAGYLPRRPQTSGGEKINDPQPQTPAHPTRNRRAGCGAPALPVDRCPRAKPQPATYGAALVLLKCYERTHSRMAAPRPTARFGSLTEGCAFDAHPCGLSLHHRRMQLS